MAELYDASEEVLYDLGEVVDYPIREGLTIRALITHTGLRRDNGKRFYMIRPLREDGSLCRARMVAQRSINRVE
jgi:hypothetical protein